LIGELIEHKDELFGGGIIDQIFGYKKIKDYTLKG
jgi:hypothetical protein